MISNLSHSPAAVMDDVIGWTGDAGRVVADMVAVEEPLEIRLAGYRVAVTMRTPGHDLDLARGFLFTEGIIRGQDDIAGLHYCLTDEGELSANIINITPRDPSIVDPGAWQRNFYTTSSCGICGKASLEAVQQRAPALSDAADGVRLDAATLSLLDGQLRAAQAIFSQTGGLHAAGLFDMTGRLLVAREDVGRHNAVDKVIGHMLGDQGLQRCALLVSGRASFEIVQKALMAGIAIIAAVSAPSSLAVGLARSSNLTLIGFLRSERFNVYTGGHRIVCDGSLRHQK